jgi:general secretion pathway protein M
VNGLRDSTSGKALALAVGVLVLGATHFGVIAPLVSHYESTAQRLLERQELVRRYQNSARELPRLRQAVAERHDQSFDRDLLLTGSTDAVAAATLQSVLKVLVELEGARLTSAEMLPEETNDDVARRVGVRIAFSGTLKLLATVIEGIETTRPVLFVGNLDIHTAPDSNGEDEGSTLAIVMDVYGLLATSAGRTP